MDISEYIYEGVVEPSYKKPTREYANPSDQSSNMKRRSRLVTDSPRHGRER